MKYSRVTSIAGGIALLILSISFNIGYLDVPSWAPPTSVSARPLAPTDASQVSSTQPAPSPADSSDGQQQTAEVAPNFSFLRPVSWDEPIKEPAFAAFAEWANQYLSSDAAERLELEAEGIQLAAERREAVRSLIQSDPARALALAVPYRIRQALPDTITGSFEEPVSGRGALDVLGALPEPGKESEVTPTFRVARINGFEYDAYVYGRRLGQPTLQDIPMNGIAVDNFLALNESPLRVLQPEEAAAVRSAAAEPICAVSGDPSTIHSTEAVVEVAGSPVFLCGLNHAEDLQATLIDEEVAAANEGGVAGSSRTEGIKNLILIRVDFSDLTGAPFSDTTGDNLIGNLNDYYSESSYGRNGFSLSGSGSEVTPTFRMPKAASYYGPNNRYNELRSDARTAAADAGYVLGDYDYDVICFGPVPGWGWAGLGYVGAAGSWLRNYFSTGVAAHELGHNYGLNHANFWNTSGQSIIGDGSSSEYGDSFDTMGSAGAGAKHFNAGYKNYLNWLQTGETLTVVANGTYRIYPHDDPSATGVRGLKIVRSSGTNYWVEFRQQFTANRWLMSGAGIRWTGNGNQRSHLLDMTPGSPNGKNDSALVLGRTFSDSAAGIHITTLRKGGTVPESLDIAVNLGTFPANVAPLVTVSATQSNVATGVPVDFSAAWSDANGDTLAYYWDFGDGTFGTNGTAATKSWTSSGEYLVRCVASDMKGGQASDSVLVRVGNPGTHRISGMVRKDGLPVEGALVSATSSKVTYTDSDGSYMLVGLSSGSYTLSAVRDGTTFTPSGFANPVSVGPNVTGIDFSSGVGGGGTVALTAPANSASYTEPATVNMTAQATAMSGQSVTNVEFFADATNLGADSSAPYSFAWVNAPVGSYSLTARMTDSVGNVVVSAPITITVNTAAPAITSQPQSQTIVAGGNASFAVTTSGATPMSYQWRLDGTNLPGATSAALSLFNVQPSQGGLYSVRVTNALGTATSANALLTVVCSYALSSSSASYSSAGGGGSVDINTQGGCAWSVNNVPGWISITAGNGGVGDGTVTYNLAPNSGSSRSAILTIGGRSHVVTQAAPDLVPPNVYLASPPANTVFTDTLITVSGTADDNIALGRVECRVGSDPYVTATGTTAWTVQLALAPGTNLISARSVDLEGNISSTLTRSVFCVVPSSLVLTINGEGSVSGVTNGQSLAIGRTYKLAAKPARGHVFSNWTGGVVSQSPGLSFNMQSNLALTANFVTNPFAAVKGSFAGLFYETNEVRLGSSGFFSLRLSSKGRFSAFLQMGKARSRASGQLGVNGEATSVIPRRGTNALTVNWEVAMDGSDVIRGSVTDGTWTAELLGDRAVFHSRTNPTDKAGKYTLILLGNPGATLAPEGDSYGTVTVNTRGSISMRGYLADNSRMSSRVALSKNGQWPLYVSLYRGGGALLGWVTFTNRAGTDLDGLVSWLKPAGARGAYYPGGFASGTALLGSRYTAPATKADPILGVSDPIIRFMGGNLAAALTNSVALGLGNKVTNNGPAALSIRFRPNNGLFSGRVEAPGEARPRRFGGVVLQKGNFGSGHFLGTNQSGLVMFEDGP